MKKKVLIFGSAGMLGHIVYQYLKNTNKYFIFDTSFPERLTEASLLLDVTNKDNLFIALKTINPDIIINCIGVLIKSSNENPSNAIYLNSYFPNQLARYTRENSCKLIHISTDCVFSGLKGNYLEQDFRDSDSIYGRSKSLGEIINAHDLTIRTSIIGPELIRNGEGLFNWFMSQKGDISGYSNVFWSGVTTLELAKCIEKSIDLDITGLSYDFLEKNVI